MYYLCLSIFPRPVRVLLFGMRSHFLSGSFLLWLAKNSMYAHI
jgi:hypothetical protein